jgi:hypothetical protein
MELTKFDMENQAIEKRKAEALEKIAKNLEDLATTVNIIMEHGLPINMP